MDPALSLSGTALMTFLELDIHFVNREGDSLPFGPDGFETVFICGSSKYKVDAAWGSSRAKQVHQHLEFLGVLTEVVLRPPKEAQGVAVLRTHAYVMGH